MHQMEPITKDFPLRKQTGSSKTENCISTILKFEKVVQIGL